MDLNQTNRLESAHESLYNFVKEKASFYNNYLGKFSPTKLKWARITLFILYLIFASIVILAMTGAIGNWFYLSVPAILINAVVMVMVFRRTDRRRENSSLPSTFMDRFGVEIFLKKELGLKKNDLPGLAAICLNLSHHYKRNYYRWDIPMGFLGTIVTVLCLAKGATIGEVGKVAVVFAMGLFALWNGMANFADSMDRRSDRYFYLYLIIEDLERNTEYQKLRKEYKQALRVSRENEAENGVAI